MRLSSADEVLAKLREDDPLKEFFTWWDRVTPEDHARFKSTLGAATREEDVQALLQANPMYLIQHLGGGHGRWVIPKQRLGSEHVTDFLIAEKHSFGFEWQAVELESPLRPMFNKNGDPSQYLNHALRQLTDWRAWLKNNQPYAARPKTEGGLGLTDIDANVKGLVLIGRRAQIAVTTASRRRQMVQDLNIEIHSYDYLLSSMHDRLVSLHKVPENEAE
jgi:hypothetical protein